MTHRNTTAYATSDAGVASVSITAAADRAWVIDWISWSNDTAADGVTVTATFGSTVLWKIYPERTGSEFFTFPGGMSNSTKNETVTVTAAAGGGDCAISVGYH